MGQASWPKSSRKGIGVYTPTLDLFKAHLQTPIFMEIVISMLWAIWMQRNDCIFKNLQHSIQNCKIIFRKELAWVKLRAKEDYKILLDAWLHNFV